MERGLEKAQGGKQVRTRDNESHAGPAEDAGRLPAAAGCFNNSGPTGRTGIVSGAPGDAGAGLPMPRLAERQGPADPKAVQEGP